jgi:hypothetical protein
MMELLSPRETDGDKNDQSNFLHRSLSGKGQKWDISQLTMIPTRQPRNTSATLLSPSSTPVSFECCSSPEAMTMAAVMGACRHMVGMRTK